MPSQTKAVHDWLAAALRLPCYVEGDAPTTAKAPYVTHRIPTSSFGDVNSIEVDVWHTKGHAAEADALCKRLYRALGYGGQMVICDGGAVVLRRGTPFSQPVADDKAEHRYINVDIEYLTD